MPKLDTAGASLHYARTGQGPPVLLIQGVGAVGNAWRPQIEALSDRYTLVSFDNRGIGEARSATVSSQSRRWPPTRWRLWMRVSIASTSPDTRWAGSLLRPSHSRRRHG